MLIDVFVCSYFDNHARLRIQICLRKPQDLTLVMGAKPIFWHRHGLEDNS